MPNILAEVRVTATCGHAAWVDVYYASHVHTEGGMARAARRPCPECRRDGSRREWLAARAVRLRNMAGKIVLGDVPQGPIHVVPSEGGWVATLSTGETGSAPSPTGAILVALAVRVESDVRSDAL